MTPDQLRELADRLAHHAALDGAPRGTERHQLVAEDLFSAIDFLRQCAEQKPVGWRQDLDPPRGNWTHWIVSSNPWPNSPHVQPLYAAPAPQPMSDERRAIEDAAYERAAQVCDNHSDELDGYAESIGAMVAFDLAAAIRALRGDAK